MDGYYEQHEHPDPRFPFIFHLDSLSCSMRWNTIHWHESIEILYFIEGGSVVFSNMINYPVTAGDIAVMNVNHIHTVNSAQVPCRYYCLIIDKSFCDELDIAVESLQFSPVVQDDIAVEFMKQIVSEIENKSDRYWRQAVKEAIIGLLVHLCRFHLCSDTTAVTAVDNKMVLVKECIRFILQRYKQPLSLDDIGERLGVSKYYFCHVFKEHTGRTINDYINFLRCCNARSLIRSGIYNVSESALMSGIPNLSYFSKTYKRHMGVSPSKEIDPDRRPL